MKKNIGLFLAMAFVFLITCIRYENNNPYDPRFDGGDFKLDITDVRTDFFVLKPYKVLFTQGHDSFDSIIPIAGTDTLINDSLFRYAKEGDFRVVYFTRPYTGALRFAGIRPNGLRVIDSLESVVVVNPFKLQAQSLCGIGETTFARIAVVDPDSIGAVILASDSVIWRVEGQPDVVTSLADSIPVFSPLKMKMFIRGWIRGRYHDSMALTDDTVSFPSYRPILDSFTLTGGAWLGDTFGLALNLRLQAATGVRVTTSIGRQHAIYDTLSASPGLPLLIPAVGIMQDTGAVACTVMVTDTFGLACTPRYLNPAKRVKYALSRPQFSLGDSTEAAVGRIKSFQLVDSNPRFVTMYFIHSAITGFTDSVTVPVYSRTYMAPCRDLLTVYGRDRFGFVGKIDSLLVKVRVVKYAVKPVVGAYPGVLALKKDVTWTVQTEDSSGAVVSGANKVEYFWSVVPVTLPSSPTFKGATASLRLVDSILPFTLKVFSIVNNTDTAASLDSTILVRAYRPQCVFPVKPIYGNAGDSVSITVRSVDTLNAGRVDSTVIEWVPNSRRYRLMGSDSIQKIYFSIPSTYMLRAWAVDNDGFSSAVDSVHVIIGSNYPYFESLTSSGTFFVKDNATLLAPVAHPGIADTSARIKSYGWDLDNDGVFERSTIVGSTRFFIADTAVKTVRVLCVNSNDDTCQYPATLRIIVLQGKPVLDSFRITTDSTYINAPVRMRFVAHDTNGTIHRIVIDTSGVGRNTITISVINASSGTLDTAVRFPKAGRYRIRAWVLDDDSIASDTIFAPETVTVDSGKSAVSSITADSVSIYIKDRRTFRIQAFDPNGVITRVAIAWNGTLTSAADTTVVLQAAAALADISVAHVYPDTVPGDSVSVVAWVTDNDNLQSARMLKKFRVNMGRPAVDSIKADSAYYIKDTCRYIVRSQDQNGSVKRVYISWAGSLTVADDSIIMSRNPGTASDTFKHAYTDTTLSKLTQTVTSWVRDDDSLVSNVKSKVITLRLGRPVISSSSVDTVRDNVFVNDSRKYTVTAIDSNGTVRKVLAKWDDGSSVVETLTVAAPARQVTVQFTHVFDIAKAGPHKIEFWTLDDDQIPSLVRRIDSVYVRKAEPVLTGDSQDTLWMVVNNGYGVNYNVHVNSRDTNGRLIKYYWSEAVSFDTATATKTNDSLYPRLIGINDVNKPFPLWAYGRDDDGFLRGGKFYVFADSAPRAIIATSDAVAGGRKLSWSGFDAKDSLATEFRVLVKRGSQPDTSAGSADVIKDWTAGSSATLGYNSTYPGYFSFTYSPAQSGTYYFQVISRDLRRTKTFSATGLTFIY